MVVPVPVVLQKENVKTLPQEVFDAHRHARGAAAGRVLGAGPVPRPRAAGASRHEARWTTTAAKARRRPGDLGVKVEAQFDGGRVRGGGAVREGRAGPRDLAQGEQVQHPRGRRAAAPPVRPEGHEVLRREGEREEGDVRERHGDAVAAALPLRHREVRAAGAPGPRSTRRGSRTSSSTSSRRTAYEVANYANVTIPTNIDLKPAAKPEFGALLRGASSTARSRRTPARGHRVRVAGRAAAAEW